MYPLGAIGPPVQFRAIAPPTASTLDSWTHFFGYAPPVTIRYIACLTRPDANFQSSGNEASPQLLFQDTDCVPIAAKSLCINTLRGLDTYPPTILLFF